ncbi:hypothetical protein SAMN04487906_0015 [Zhouia amylolytica]|uniref:Uncharacterized protein n=1 Tax=Zhouia amylolytica TaxID=376730 RepID=A0A1I6NYL5_9FLAO|nr:hypothetical protein SAMN04487906_0015 [Zhouia amylolytica]
MISIIEIIDKNMFHRFIKGKSHNDFLGIQQPITYRSFRLGNLAGVLLANVRHIVFDDIFIMHDALTKFPRNEKYSCIVDFIFHGIT